MTKEEIFEQIRLMLSQLFEIDKEEITLESKLFEELELDSIDAVDLVVKLQKTIGKKIMPEEFKQVRTVKDVVDVVYKITHEEVNVKKADSFFLGCNYPCGSFCNLFWNKISAFNLCISSANCGEFT